MKVLVIGSGGREHAIAWKIAQSSLLEELYIAPGNPGTEALGQNLPIDPMDFNAIAEAVKEKEIEFVVVGPEAPLVEGIADFLKEQAPGCTVIGPSKAGAMLEGSKQRCKEFLADHNIPTAKYRSFSSKELKAAIAYLEELSPPYVLKADGLAAGKGVLICPTKEEAKNELKEMLVDGKFGDAGANVVIEEFLDGIELSVFIITDGRFYKTLPVAKDYKRIGEDDTGLNTGGMGAVSPVPFADRMFMQKVEERIIGPTVRGIREEGIDYKGFLFIGLMNVKGDPYVVEFNARMGDPETEVVMVRLKSDLLDLFEGIATETLSERHVEEDELCAATIVAVSEGYPEKYEKGKPIRIEAHDSERFHMGTRKEDGLLVTNGGRVLACTGKGRTLEKALKSAYEGAAGITFDGCYYRKDIGQDLVQVPAK